jgi:hypothetical protein
VNSALDELGQFEQALRRILWELREYLDDIVVIGGWVPYLYREYGGFSEWRSSLSRTGEVDILIGSPLETRGRKAMTVILSEAGFLPTTDEQRAAVWIGEVEQGEKIEFLTPHRDTAKQIGGLQPVESQVDLGAISLPWLELLLDFTKQLALPVTIEGKEAVELAIRVPWLGAYLANKAATFPKRRSAAVETVTENPKKAKDLLYIRDLAASGEEVAQSLSEDCTAIRRAGKRDELSMDYAVSNLRLLEGGTFAAQLEEAAEMLAERDGIGHQEALADMQGHLRDARELLEGA